MMAVSNPSVLASLMKATDGFDELTDQERFVFSVYAASVLRNHFVAHELMQSGLLPRAQGQTFEAALRRAIQQYPGIRQLWALRRDEYPEGFRATVDALVSEAEAAELNATE